MKCVNLPAGKSRFLRLLRRDDRGVGMKIFDMGRNLPRIELFGFQKVAMLEAPEMLLKPARNCSVGPILAYLSARPLQHEPRRYT
jgi:hypothetical protein